MNDSHRFVLLKTIKGIKDNVDKMAPLGYDDTQYIRNEFSGYLKQLVDAFRVILNHVRQIVWHVFKGSNQDPF